MRETLLQTDRPPEVSPATAPARSLSGLVPDLLPLLGFAAAVAVLFRDGLLGHEFFYEYDTELYYYPLTRWFAAQWREGHLPLWLPGLFSGYPILADGEIGPLYPPKLLALRLLEPVQALVWLRVVHYWLAATSTYALLRALGAARLGASVGGLVFAFGGYLAAQMHHENVVQTAVWLPLVLLLGELALRRRGWAHQRYLVAAGLALGMALLGLHVQPALMAGMALGLYLAARAAAEGWAQVRSEKPPLRRAAGALLATAASLWRTLVWPLALIGGLGAALAGAQLLPLLEQARASFRAEGVGYEFASAFAVAPANLPTLLFPFFFRLPDGGWWMLWNQWEVLFYVGVAPLLLAPLGLQRAPRWVATYLGLLALASLLAAMAHYGPLNLHEALWRLPGLSFLRAPGRFSYLFTFAIAGLAAFGTDWLADPRRSRRALTSVGVATLGVLAALAALLAGLHAWLLRDPAGARALLSESYLALRRQHEDLALEMVYRGLLWSTDLANPKTLLTLGLLGALALLVLTRLRSAPDGRDKELERWRNGENEQHGEGARTRPSPFRPVSLSLRLSFAPSGPWSLALALLVASDLLAFAYDFHPRISAEALNRPTPLVQALATLGVGRVLAAPGVAELEPNRALLGGVADASGYSSLPSQRHFDYWSRARRVPDALLDLWAVDAYVSAASERDLISRDGYVFSLRQPLLEGVAGTPFGRATFRVPGVEATEVHVIGWLSHAVEVPQGTPVGSLVVEDGPGTARRLDLLAGPHLAERAYERADVRPAVRHARPTVLYSAQDWGADGAPFQAHAYLARLKLGERIRVQRLRLQAELPRLGLTVFGLALADEAGRPVHSVASTDRERLEAVQTLGRTTIYRNASAYPRAFVVFRSVGPDPDRRESPLAQILSGPFDPAAEVYLERYFGADRPISQPPPAAVESAGPLPAHVEDVSNEHVRVRAALSEPGFVVLADLYHRGWQASVDGRPAPLYLANTLFRAVPVPAGEHVVDFVFDPLSLRLGAGLSLAGMVFATAVLGGSALWEARRRQARARIR